MSEDTSSPPAPPPALRVVHLLGGLRAFDLKGDLLPIGCDGAPSFFALKRPTYRTLFSALENFGLQPIGAHFITSHDIADGLQPIQWKLWRPPPVGLNGLLVEREWSHVRHKASGSGDTEIARISRKVTTFLRLLILRLEAVSEAYHSMLLCKITLNPTEATCKPGMFDSLWGHSVEASLHAFLSDAASLRDALAEAAWNLVLKRTDGDVSSMASFIKRAKGETEPCVAGILKEADDGGWIKNLTDIRNEVVHVVPVSGFNEHSFLELRELKLRGQTLPYLHLPLTTQNWALRKGVSRQVDFRDEEAIKASIEEFTAFAASSGDALEYVWRTTAHLIGLADEVRNAAGLQAQMPVIVAPPGTVVTRRVGG